MRTDLAVKTSKFVINEILPRSKKISCAPSDFLHPLIANILIKCEMNGTLHRKQIREFLDHYLENNTVHSDNTKTVLYTIAKEISSE